MGDNSLLRKHHILVLDLPVQGQDVIINERALRVKTQRKEVGPGPKLMLETGPISLGVGAALGLHSSGGNLSNLLRAWHTVVAQQTLTEQMSLRKP